MLHADGPQFWRFLSRQSFPYHHWIPSDLNLCAFHVWIQSAPRRAQYEVARAHLPIIIHRHPLDSGPVPPIRFATDHGEQTLQPIGCTYVWCDRWDARGGYKWPWDGPWVCIKGRGSSRTDGNAIRQNWLSCRYPDCASHGAPDTSEQTLKSFRDGVSSPHCNTLALRRNTQR